jgi:hypothetical protein
MTATPPRSGMLNMRIEPKLKYLAELAAREENMTLSFFVTRAIQMALEAGQSSNDANSEESPFEPISRNQLRSEGFWDIDEADRFFKLATFRHDLLTDAEKRLWKLFGLCIPCGKVTKQQFREFWNSPSINTSHFQEGVE